MIDFFIIFTIGTYIFLKIILDIHEIQYIKKAKASKEELDNFSIDAEFFKKSNLYNIDKLVLSIASMVINGSLIIYFIYFEGISSFKEIISYGCQLCKENSKYSNQKVKIIWTTCKNVSFGNTPGEAIISGKLNNFTIQYK